MSTNTEKKTPKKVETLPTSTVDVKPTTPAVVPRARTIEELNGASANNMTQTEAIKYIKYLREEVVTAKAKIKALEDNTKGAFEKAAHFERLAIMVDGIHGKQHDFIISSLRNLLTAVENTTRITAQQIETVKKGNSVL